MTSRRRQSQPRQKRLLRKVVIGLLTLFFCAVFVALGIWQLQRLSWKLDLIARVTARVHAPAIPAPAPANWALVNRADDEYRHVRASGKFRNDKENLVYASSARGPGYWVLTPLIQPDGSAIYINRGFVPLDRKGPKTRPQSQVSGPVTLTGLLRLNEPKGTLLRANRPQEGWWYSRDVVAMAKHDGIANAAPFFIDADKGPNPNALPIGGLTVIHFPNSHLSYAITWFVLALMSLVGGGIALRAETRQNSKRSRENII